MVKWTEEQEQAINIRNKSLLVSAAAGSGKTAILIERMKGLIRDEKVPLDRILMVTFTNAAASEMREKILRALPEQGTKIHKANISTFHGFALQIIKRYFHVLPIEPNFKICDEVQKVILQKKSIDDLFSDEFEREDPAFLNYVSCYASSKNEDAAKQIVLDFHEFLQSLPDPGAWVEEQTASLEDDATAFFESAAYREIQDDVFDGVTQAIAIIEGVIELTEDGGLEKLTIKLRRDQESLKGICHEISAGHGKWAPRIREFVWQRMQPAKDEKAQYELIKEEITLRRKEAKDRISALKERYAIKEIEEYIGEIQATLPQAKILCRLVEDFDRRYREAKEKKGVLDFADIEHYALKILKNEAVAEEYRKKFQWIFIDEYQDSNLIQEELIRRIRREDNVFMVGDVKQSIYKFRLAEPEIFLRRYEACRRGENPWERKIDLNRNFRSRGPIIDGVNQVFRRIMTKRTGGMVYDDEASLYLGRDTDGSSAYPVELHLVEDKQPEGEPIVDEFRELKKAELEAHTAVEIIRNTKDIPYRDIVLLLRSASGTGEIFSAVLEEAGIPTYMDLGDGYFDTLELSVFVNLLRLIDNRRQDVPLLSLLRSPIVALSIDDMAHIRTACPRGSYYTAFCRYGEKGDDPGLKSRCQETLDRIDYWRNQKRYLPLGEFLWSLMMETGYYHYVGALPGGLQRQANLRALVDKATAHEAAQGEGLFGFINVIDAMKKGRIATAPVKLFGEGDNVVRIMTVHKSKGLEFPMVILANLGRKFHVPKGRTLVCHKDLGYALKQVDRSESSYRKTLLQNAIETKKAREDFAEEIRILYVGMTRAMERLVLLGTVSDASKAMSDGALRKKSGRVGGSTYLEDLIPALLEDGKTEMIFHDRVGIGTGIRQRRRQKEDLRRRMDGGFPVEPEVEEIVARRLEWMYPYPEALCTKSKYSVTELGRIDAGQSALGIQKSGFTAGAEAAAQRGTAYHKVMERIPFSIEMQAVDAVGRAIETLVDSGHLTQEEGDLVDPDGIAGFFQSPVGKRACQAPEVHRETPFTTRHQVNGEDVIVQGIIDCHFREGESYVLLDYKSNTVDEDSETLDQMSRQFRPQLMLYKQALEEIRGLRVDEMYVYLFSLGREIRL